VFVIALVLAHMGQRLLEQSRMLVGLHSAATHLSAGHSTREILGRLADSLTDLLEVESVAVATGEGSPDGALATFGNLDPEQGEILLRLGRDCLASAPRANAPFTIISS